MSIRNRQFIVISFIILATFLFVYITLPKLYTVKLPDDAKLYDGIARAIVDGKSNISTPGYYADGEDIGYTLMPGYSFFVAVIYLFFGKQNYYAVLAAQSVITLLSIYVFYLILRRNFSKWRAIIFLALFGLYVNQWSYNAFLLIESLSISFLIFSLYALERYFKDYSPRWIAIFAVLFGILVSLNNRFIFHFAFLGVYFLFLVLTNKEIKLIHILIMGGVFLAILLPWHIRQYLQYNQLVFFSPLRAKVANNEQVKETMNTMYQYVPSYDTVVNLYMSQYLVKDFRKEKKEDFMKKFTVEDYNKLKSNYDGFGKIGAYKTRVKGFFEVYRSDFRFGFAGDMRLEAPSFYDKNIVWFFDLFDLILLGPAFLFLLISIPSALYSKHNLAVVSIIIVLAHLILHTLVNYLPRYRITIIPTIFLGAFLGYGLLSELIKKKLVKK